MKLRMRVLDQPPRLVRYLDRTDACLAQLLIAGLMVCGLLACEKASDPSLQTVGTATSSSNYHPRRLFVLNEDVMWVTLASEIWQSKNAGRTWDRIGDVALERSGDSIFFIDMETGWTVGGDKGQVFRTDDGGRTWAKLTDIEEGDDSRYYAAESMLFRSKDEGWILDTFALWYTSNGGKSWTKTPNLDFHDSGFGTPSKLESYKGLFYFLTRSGSIGQLGPGDSWKPIVQGSTSAAEFCTAGNGVFRLASYEKLVVEAPVTRTLASLPNEFENRSMACQPNITLVGGGYLGRGDTKKNIGQLAVIVDTGQTNLIDFPDDSTIVSVVAGDARTFYVEGDRHLWSTQDAGATWTQLFNFEMREPK